MFSSMKEQFVQIFWSLTLFSAFKNTSGSGKVTVLLINYGNSKSQVADGSCCDNFNWCINNCDNFFRLCFALTSSSDKCGLWKGWTPVVGGDSFSFSKGSLGNGITNPVTYTFTRWQPIVFDVEVWDSDDGHIVGQDKDFVDRYSLSIRTSPSPNLASARAKRYKLTGPGYSYLNVELKVFCDENYFVPDCSKYCAPRDDNTGHYICDYTQGRRVCLSGWYGSDCLTYCVARNDTLGHFSCDANGQKHCLNNWYGQDCLVYCRPRNDTQGHYMCDSNGSVDCLPGWRGKNCTEENVKSSSKAISLLATFSSCLVSVATTVPAPLTPSSVDLLLRSSTYNIGKSKETAETYGLSTNNAGSTALTSSVSGHGLIRNKTPHLSAPMTTSTEYSVILYSVLAPATTWATVCVSAASDSTLVSRRTLHVLLSRLTTSSELKELQRTEITRVTISLKFQYTLKSVHRTSLFPEVSRSNPRVEKSEMTNTSKLLHRTLELTNLPPSVPSSKIGATANTPTGWRSLSFLSLRQNQTSLPHASSTLGISSSQSIMPTLFSTCTIGLPRTTLGGIMTKAAERKETIHHSQTLLRSVSSLQTITSTLMPTSSVALRCATNEEVTALPTAQPEETSTSHGIIVRFQPVRDNQELEVPWVVQTMKNVLAEQLNLVCRETIEACNLSEEDIFSVWFCPPDVNVEIHDVREQGVSFKVTAVLPPPLNGIIPLQTMLDVLKMRKEDLESTTQTNITWIPPYGSTTSRISYKSPGGQLSRASSRESTSPLPYVFGFASAGLILVVALLIVRAKLNKNRIHPCVEDEILPSPAYECQPDTILLLSQTKRDKEEVSMNIDNDVYPPGAIEENNL